MTMLKPNKVIILAQLNLKTHILTNEQLFIDQINSRKSTDGIKKDGHYIIPGVGSITVNFEN